jgi:hypothetical protein
MVGALALALAPAGATGAGNASAPGPSPSSLGSAAVTHGKLVAGAGGTYLPITPTGVASGGSHTNPLAIPPPGPDPQGMSCPTPNIFHIGPGSPGPGGGVIAVLAIHPSFTINKIGGYDGADAPFGYAAVDAIPPGGDPLAIAVGSPATAANVGGHLVAVTAFLRVRGTWQDARTVAPYGGVASERSSRSAPHTSRGIFRHPRRLNRCSPHPLSRPGRTWWRR